MKTPDQIALEVVDQLSFSSNRMLNGRLVGEQYFATMAVADAITTERAEIRRLREALFKIQCEQLDRATNKRRAASTLRKLAWQTRDEVLALLSE